MSDGDERQYDESTHTYVDDQIHTEDTRTVSDSNETSDRVTSSNLSFGKYLLVQELDCQQTWL
eukprot:m.176199 g.176199  ORF g.176199 m.176199 type:complete len:63 (+) comp31842_c8_seq2:527-715(+)